MGVIINGGTVYGNGAVVSGGGGNSSLNYSTEEQVVGTWIDGRTIYQKTINNYDVKNTPNGTVLIAENFDIPISLPTGIATFISKDGGYGLGILPQTSPSIDYQIGINITTDGYVIMDCGNAILNENYYSSVMATITFQYVKKTD